MPIALRIPTEADADAWHRLFDDPAVMRFLGGRPLEPAAYQEFTARQRHHAAQYGFCLWTLLGESGEPVGFTGAQPWPRTWGPVGEIEIGWRLGSRYWGRGYASQAATLALDRLRECGVSGVVAMVDVRNERSLAVTRRLGMRPAETWVSPASGRTVVCHRLDLDDWDTCAPPGSDPELPLGPAV